MVSRVSVKDSRWAAVTDSWHDGHQLAWVLRTSRNAGDEPKQKRILAQMLVKNPDFGLAGGRN